MQLLFMARDRQAQALRDWVLVRLRFALRRLSWRVARASVQMSDVDGPRHGVDKRCQVSLKAADGTPVVVTATARDWHSAVNLALSRAIDVFKRLSLRTQQSRRTERLFVRATRTLSLRSPA